MAVEVKRYDLVMGLMGSTRLCEVDDGRCVLHTDYATLASELAEYKAKARRWYQPDGSFVELTEDEVIEKRKQAAKDLSELAATRAVLKSVEWSGTDYDQEGDRYECCPSCRADESLRSHKPGCKLAAALSAADGGTR